LADDCAFLPRGYLFYFLFKFNAVTHVNLIINFFFNKLNLEKQKNGGNVSRAVQTRALLSPRLTSQPTELHTHL
jgi:hypothetical protein